MMEITAQTANKILFRISAKSIDGIEVAAEADCSIRELIRMMELLDVIQAHGSMKDVYAALTPGKEFSGDDGGGQYFDDVENAVDMLIRLLDKIDDPMMFTIVDEKELDRKFAGIDNLSHKARRLDNATTNNGRNTL